MGGLPKMAQVALKNPPWFWMFWKRISQVDPANSLPFMGKEMSRLT
jgi:hypothetical protein